MAGYPVVHLPVVHQPEGEPPEDIGTGHPMREVTERVAADPSTWNSQLARLVGEFFDERAPGWSANRTDRAEVLLDALDRGGSLAGPVLELGAGTGSGTRVLTEHFGHAVAGDLAGIMLANLEAPGASAVQLDSSRLPVRSGSVGTVVCVNMFLFTDEVCRVLRDDGAVVWVNSIGQRTPIHLSAEAVAEALGADYEVTASRAGWGTWAVAQRGAAKRG